MRTILCILKGLFWGYVAYLPIILVVEYCMYRRLDSEKAFYALYYPLGAVFLVFPSMWKNTPRDEIILNLIGGVLLVLGVAVELRLRRRADLA
jgi:hypothetical protein